MNGCICHIEFCDKTHNVVCFVLPSCCTTPGRDPTVLLSNTFVHCMVTNNQQTLNSVSASRTFLCSFGRPAHTNYGRSGIVGESPTLIPSTSILHRFLWEQNVAKKVKVCKLISQLSSCTLFMGAKRWAKSLETFTFDNNGTIWSKSLQTFCVANVAEESCTAEITPVRGPAKKHELFSKVTQPIHNHTREPHTTHTTQTWTWICLLYTSPSPRD